MSPPFPADVPNWCQIYCKSPAGMWCQPTSLCQPRLVNQWDICSCKCVNKPSGLSSSLLHDRRKWQSLHTSQVMSKPKQRCVFLWPGVFLLDIRGRYITQQQNTYRTRIRELLNYHAAPDINTAKIWKQVVENGIHRTVCIPLSKAQILSLELHCRTNDCNSWDLRSSALFSGVQ